MGKKEQRIVLASDHSPIRVGDKIVLETISKRPPRMTIEELAQEMREGFAKVNMRIDKLETKLNSVIVLNNLKTE